MATKRMRGITISRQILIGSTATPLSDAEKLTSPPDHTHKWTVAVRSAASNPLPTISGKVSQREGSSSATGPKTPAGEEAASGGSQSTTPSGVSTRGREHEADYHKMVGGKDDISHFVKRVQFKLHETYPQSTRNIDRPPFQVTETGWGEFDIQIKIFFISESGEKPVTCFHRLKLHPWHPIAVPASEASMALAPTVEGESRRMEDVVVNQAAQSSAPEHLTTAPDGLNAEMEVKEERDQQSTNGRKSEETGPEAPATSADINTGAPQNGPQPPGNRPAVVHSWSYDEIVFPEPTEAFYDILIANPPTPLFPQSAQAFTDPTAFRRYQSSLEQLNDASGPLGRDINDESGIEPPHPLHNASGALFDALSQEAVASESERLNLARICAVKEMEETRSRLIEGEKKLRESKRKLGLS